MSKERKAADLLYGKRQSIRTGSGKRPPVPTSIEMLRTFGDIAQSICSVNNEILFEAEAKERTGVDDIEKLNQDERAAIYEELNNDEAWKDSVPFLKATFSYDHEKVTAINIRVIDTNEWMVISECARHEKIWYVTGQEISSGATFISNNFEELNDREVCPVITYAFTKLDVNGWPVWDFTKGEPIE